MDEAERQFDQSQQKQRLFGEFRYAASTWDRQRRVIVKAERLMEGPNMRFVITSLKGEPQALYDEVYCQRGEVENRIKEQQLGLFADRTSCQKLYTNQFRLILSSAAYVLLQTMRRTALDGTDLARSQVNTIRLKVLKVAARVEITVRRVVFHMASSYPYQQQFRKVLERIGGPHMTPI